MLEYLALRNFKSFHETEVGFGALTLLSGLNGSGKSTVIQALGLLRQSFDANFLLGGEVALNGELVEIGSGRDVLFHDFDSPEIEITLGAVRAGDVIDLTWRMSVQSEADVLACNGCPNRDDLSPLELFGDGFQFLRADRITPAVSFPKSQHAVRQRHFLGARGEYTAHFLLEFGEELATAPLVRSRAEPEAVRLTAQVNGWMQEFSPGVRLEAVPVPMTDYVRLVFSYKGEGAAFGEP